MTIRAGFRNSPYLVAFMLTAVMTWSFSAITRTMDGALQQTQVQLRVPVAELGTAIQDSAIALKHRFRPQTQAEPSAPESVREAVPSGHTVPPIQEALTPASVQEITALTELIASSTRSKGKARDKHMKKTGPASKSSSGKVLGPPSPDSDPSRGKRQARGQAVD